MQTMLGRKIEEGGREGVRLGWDDIIGGVWMEVIVVYARLSFTKGVNQTMILIEDDVSHSRDVLLGFDG